MTRFEAHLSRAPREVADEVPAGSVPPLKLWRPPRGRAAAHGSGDEARARWRAGWLAPVTAAASVAAIAAAFATIASLGHDRPPPGATAAAKVPPFYMALRAGKVIRCCNLPIDATCEPPRQAVGSRSWPRRIRTSPSSQ